METRDLDSYISGYDEYCEDLEEQAKVPYSDYEKLEEKINIYGNLIEKITSTFEEEITSKEKIKIIKALIEDYEEDLYNV